MLTASLLASVIAQPDQATWCSGNVHTVIGIALTAVYTIAPHLPLRSALVLEVSASKGGTLPLPEAYSVSRLERSGVMEIPANIYQCLV